MQQHLLDLVGGDAVAKRSAHMHGQLLVVAHRGQDGQGDAGAGASIQARAAPDVAPGVAGDEVLEVGCELAPDQVADRSMKWSRSSRVTCSGCSILARWAAPA